MVHVSSGVGVNSIHETSFANHLNPDVTHSVPTAFINDECSGYGNASHLDVHEKPSKYCSSAC